MFSYLSSLLPGEFLNNKLTALLTFVSQNALNEQMLNERRNDNTTSMARAGYHIGLRVQADARLELEYQPHHTLAV